MFFISKHTRERNIGPVRGNALINSSEDLAFKTEHQTQTLSTLLYANLTSGLWVNNNNEYCGL